MFGPLMTARRFAPLFWCQFLSAFNDNFVRQMLAMLIIFRFGEEGGGIKILLATAVFVLPSIPLSSIGGEIADANDKAFVARRLKFAEIFVQMIAAAGFWLGRSELLFVSLFGLGCISALFGPIKYGILPDHLKRDELVAGNALVEGATFAAIICGLVFGGYAADAGRSAASVVAQLALVAVACWLTSLWIPATGVGAPGLKVNYNPFTATARILRELKADDRSWVGAVGVSWFWMIGAITLSLAPAIVKSRIGGDIGVATWVNVFFAVGIAAGSLLAAQLAHGRIRLAPAPFMLIAMGLLAIDIGRFAGAIAPSATPMTAASFFTSATGLRFALEIAAYSCAAGLFVVPIFSAVQSWSSEDKRARVIGAVNTLNSIYMVVGSLAVSQILAHTGMDEATAFVWVGVANLFAAIYFFARLPANFLAYFLRGVWRVAFRLEVAGLENLPPAGERCIVALNHVSFLDAPLILSLLDENPIFAVDAAIANRWWMQPFLRMADARPLDPTKPLATRALIQAVREGRRLVIFPEGRITVTGSLMKVYDGAAMIAEKADALVVPVRLDGPERTSFSRLGKAQAGRRWFPKVVVTLMPPRRIAVDPDLKGRARRRAAGAALYDIMSDLVFATSNTRRTLHQAFEDGLRQRGDKGGRIAVQDPTGELTLSRFRLGVALVARKIAALSRPGETLGFFLPNANGAAVTFMAIQSAGRRAAMLNFTAGAFNLIAACKAANVRTVLTSRTFVEKGKFEDIVTQLEAHFSIVWLEDLRAKATKLDMLRAVLTRGRPLFRPAPEDPAVVLFTSGSEGAPKGVALSHVNILANIAQVAARFDFTTADIIFNPLPIFHSFGLTGGLMLGLVNGLKIYLYPNPLHYRQIPELVYSVNATALFGTDTFLAGYAKMANPYDFRTVRYVVAGGEPVKPETRRAYMEKFGLRILEGYGVTETSPVLAVNTPMFNRNGTVGRLMPTMDYRLEPVPGIEDGGRLHVRGPNIMAGYYRADNPGELEPPPGGWHDTGDIVSIDREGFVTIKGRAKRFAKIGGEMISLAAVEGLMAELWPDEPLALVAVPDARKGEKLILATTRRGATRAEAQAWLKIKGASELMAPAAVVVLDEMPVLGAGKTDYVKLGEMMRERFA